MVQGSDATFELLQRFYNEFRDSRRDAESMKSRMAAMEQHMAAIVGDLAQVRIELDDIRSDVSRIKTRLDLVDA
ncbi:MAG: hypothetical protein AVDCRST_MAG91-2767 [uncultured Sphingomonadaceae bacterium]|uniref:Uncharacterized protein n=1 Tax=uncultured Sphingomonadaceae bacterium TaxID=169976 RepID=A0A6J4TP62_9SPHN|nr:MAG: hypothetical protein AVDCRST_MAG91-2767 [uncultured Sphingomonadaceae bacterium]